MNSHKRCSVNCNTPPTTTTGVFWQEMTSPPFRNTAATDESEDILQVCFNFGGACNSNRPLRGGRSLHRSGSNRAAQDRLRLRSEWSQAHVMTPWAAT